MSDVQNPVSQFLAIVPKTLLLSLIPAAFAPKRPLDMPDDLARLYAWWRLCSPVISLRLKSTVLAYTA